MMRIRPIVDVHPSLQCLVSIFEFAVLLLITLKMLHAVDTWIVEMSIWDSIMC